MNYMTNFFKKTWLFAKKYKKTSLLCLVILGVVSYFVFFKNSEESIQTATAQVGDVVQEVSITGRVKAAEAVDLAFERSGKISSINVKVGNKVYNGQALVRLDAGELLAQRARELADVQAAKQRVAQVISGNNLKGDKDVARTALETAINGLVVFTDNQIKYFRTTGQDEVINLKEKSIVSIYGNYVGGLNGDYFFLNLNGGLKERINAMENTPDADRLSVLEETETALLTVKNSLDFMKGRLLLMKSDPLITEGIDGAINKILSQVSIVTAQRKSSTGGNFDIDIARSQLAQAEAGLALIDAQLAKYAIYAPFSGTITSVSAKRGEITNPGAPAVSLIGVNNLEIEAQISEADVSKINIGDDVNVTLDAYGADEVFPAKLVHIDPAGKVVDGVAVYLATFVFLNKNDKILPGLTADLDIQAQRKNNVLYIPSRDVISKGGKKYVKVLTKGTEPEPRFASLTAVSQTEKGQIFEVEIRTGLKGSDGRIEITSGLQEGDQIVKE